MSLAANTWIWIALCAMNLIIIFAARSRGGIRGRRNRLITLFASCFMLLSILMPSAHIWAGTIGATLYVVNAIVYFCTPRTVIHDA